METNVNRIMLSITAIIVLTFIGCEGCRKHVIATPYGIAPSHRLSATLRAGLIKEIVDDHESYPMIPPDVFLPVLEDIGRLDSDSNEREYNTDLDQLSDDLGAMRWAVAQQKEWSAS